MNTPKTATVSSSTPVFSTLALEPVDDLLMLKNWSFEIDQLNAQYAQTLDEGNFKAWPDFFIDCAQYKIQARENYERGLPLCLVDLESKGMMKDRVYGITETIFHAPYYARHIISQSLILGMQTSLNTHEDVKACLNALTQQLGTALPSPEPVKLLVSKSNYAVFRTKPGKTSEVFNVGVYVDHWLMNPKGLKLASRQCIYDSEMILNSLIYPL